MMTSTLFLAAPGGTHTGAAIAPFLPARLDYRLSPELRLMRAGEVTSARGGLMVLSDEVCSGRTGPAAVLCRQILAECQTRQFTGVAADFSLPVQEPLRQVLRQLWPLLEREGLLLFVTARYADDVPQAQVLLPCQFRDGSLRAHLEDYQSRWGSRAALDLSRMCHDYPMGGGEPEPLTQEALRRLRVRFRPMSFYSRELYANYFTYRGQNGLHFVLYDEANTLRQKLQLADSLGFSQIFLLYQEVEDLFPRLLRDVNQDGTIK